MHGLNAIQVQNQVIHPFLGNTYTPSQPTLTNMSAEWPIDEDYASEEDSDFAPDGAPADDASAASESGNEGPSDLSAPAAKRKRAATGDDGPADADADDYDNSGDEAIIHKGHKRQNKERARNAAGGNDEDEGGEGGLVKTRSMRAAEKAERKTQAQTGPVTINVDDIWAQMTADPIIPPKTTAGTATRPGAEVSSETAANTADGTRPGARGDKGTAPLIQIKRTYNFAGKVHAEERMVPRDSAEARVYLASLGPGAADAVAAAGADDAEGANEAPKRQPRKAFRSAFEPAVESLAQRADLQLGMAARLRLREQAAGKAKKLNVVEKSRMDWAGFVDEAGIQDELALAGKSKESYASRQNFLARVDAKKEDDARRARMAGRG